MLVEELARRSPAADRRPRHRRPTASCSRSCPTDRSRCGPCRPASPRSASACSRTCPPTAPRSPTWRSASPGCTSCCARAASAGRCWRWCRCSWRSASRRSLVWMLDITLSPLTTVSGPLVVASVAEFSVLIMGRHIEERQDGLGPVDAIHMAARRTGRAFFTSALHDHRRLRRADLVVAAAAARLRHHRHAQRRDRLAGGAGADAADAGVGRPSSGCCTSRTRRTSRARSSWPRRFPVRRHRLAVVGALAFAGGAVGELRLGRHRQGRVDRGLVRAGPSTTTTTTTTTTRPPRRRPRTHAGARRRPRRRPPSHRPRRRSDSVPDRASRHAGRRPAVRPTDRAGRRSQRRQLRDPDRLRDRRRADADRDGHRPRQRPRRSRS